MIVEHYCPLIYAHNFDGIVFSEATKATALAMGSTITQLPGDGSMGGAFVTVRHKGYTIE